MFTRNLFSEAYVNSKITKKHQGVPGRTHKAYFPTVHTSSHTILTF